MKCGDRRDRLYTAVGDYGAQGRQPVPPAPIRYRQQNAGCPEEREEHHPADVGKALRHPGLYAQRCGEL